MKTKRNVSLCISVYKLTFIKKPAVQAQGNVTFTSIAA